MSVFGHTFEIMFNEDGQFDQGAYPLVGNDTQCMGLAGTCFVEIFVPSVAVYRPLICRRGAEHKIH